MTTDALKQVAECVLFKNLLLFDHFEKSMDLIYVFFYFLMMRTQSSVCRLQTKEGVTLRPLPLYGPTRIIIIIIVTYF
jgi:hypothetical protein